MRFDKEFRDTKRAEILIGAIHSITHHPWRIMEICGGQTHAFAKYRLEEHLPKEITWIHGPGCPVCVTPAETIEMALSLAEQKDVIFTSFGDMLRVPGNRTNLLEVKACGADIRIVYSPLDALKIAQENPNKEIIFFAIGFETTIPIHAMTLAEAARKKIHNFSMLTSLFTVPAAIRSLKEEPDCDLDGILAAGHVCAITGIEEYRMMAKELKMPIAVTGFEPIDLLYGIYHCIKLLESGSNTVFNAYKRIVLNTGNTKAQQIIDQVFIHSDQAWRGLGIIPNSGYKMRPEYEHYDALERFGVNKKNYKEKNLCRAGDIMRGKIQPELCQRFGKNCTPQHPLGAPMVSSEGACAAYYRYKL